MLKAYSVQVIKDVSAKINDYVLFIYTENLHLSYLHHLPLQRPNYM